MAEGTTHCCSGYCIDMLENIAANVSFNFTIHLSSDGLYGSFERVSLKMESLMCMKKGKINR